ncbi:hypothetical protein CEXT_42461 [Caerostris extrusa]|uniref:Uncharacterized protein n=1 Tax=Caerostris extrusa TaxID=172846 RepID=A0AAV4MBS8_CAEEX|nr:hypothetical protein CEXT_42461 [Caerostris extrusa]
MSSCVDQNSRTELFFEVRGSQPVYAQAIRIVSVPLLILSHLNHYSDPYNSCYKRTRESISRTTYNLICISVGRTLGALSLIIGDHLAVPINYYHPVVLLAHDFYCEREGNTTRRRVNGDEERSVPREDEVHKHEREERGAPAQVHPAAAPRLLQDHKELLEENETAKKELENLKDNYKAVMKIIWR